MSSFSLYIAIYQTIFIAIYHSTIVNKLCRRIIYPLIDARHIFAFTFYLFVFFRCRVLSGRKQSQFFFYFDFRLFFLWVFLSLSFYLYSSLNECSMPLLLYLIWKLFNAKILIRTFYRIVCLFVQVNFRKVCCTNYVDSYF